MVPSNAGSIPRSARVSRHCVRRGSPDPAETPDRRSPLRPWIECGVRKYNWVESSFLSGGSIAAAVPGSPYRAERMWDLRQRSTMPAFLRTNQSRSRPTPGSASHRPERRLSWHSVGRRAQQTAAVLRTTQTTMTSFAPGSLRSVQLEMNPGRSPHDNWPASCEEPQLQ